MKDLNMVFLMGNLTRDPELRYTPNGQAVTSMTVATNRQWNDKESGESESPPERHHHLQRPPNPPPERNHHPGPGRPRLLIRIRRIETR